VSEEQVTDATELVAETPACCDSVLFSACCGKETKLACCGSDEAPVVCGCSDGASDVPPAGQS
jgi:hypothetical protein